MVNWKDFISSIWCLEVVDLSEKDVYITFNLATKHGKRLSLFLVVYHSWNVGSTKLILLSNVLKFSKKQKKFSKNSIYLYIGLFDWTRWALFSPPMRTLMKNNEHSKTIICINNLIPKPFLTHSWPNFDPIPNHFSFKCPYTYTLDIFSCLFSTCTREWSKQIIKITKDENSYHLCS